MTDPRDRRLVAGAAALAALAVLATALAPTLVGARPANQIPIQEASADDGLSDPTAEAWNDSPTVVVPLSSANSGLPGADDTSVQRVHVRAATTEDRLYLRLSWADATADRAADSPRTFADAAAVQFPANTSARPPIAMGSTRNTVNVWYWSGAGANESLLAGGPSTTTEFRNPAIETTATHEDGRWYVVYERELTAPSENRTDFAVDRDVDVAIAVWNGSNMERSGVKGVSEWYHLPFGPGPQGPPYETILWAVAGIAIVVVAGATIAAVRGA